MICVPPGQLEQPNEVTIRATTAFVAMGCLWKLALEAVEHDARDAVIGASMAAEHIESELSKSWAIVMSEADRKVRAIVKRYLATHPAP